MEVSPSLPIQAGTRYGQEQFPDNGPTTHTTQSIGTIPIRDTNACPIEDPFRPASILSTRMPLNSLTLGRGGRLRYPSGGGARAWGPFRAELRPANRAVVCDRSGFFFHLDVTDDGTAGCIGISKRDEAKFNQMVALMMRNSYRQ